MSNLAKVLSELQSVQRNMNQGQDEVRNVIMEEVAGLVQSFTMLREELHCDFQRWLQDATRRVVETVRNQLGAQMEDLRRWMSQMQSCSW